VEGLETQGRRRVQLERALNRPSVCQTRRRELARRVTALTLVAVVVPACASRAAAPTPSAVASTTSTTSTTTPVPATTTTTLPPASEPYSWQQDDSLSLDLGGGATSSLSAVVPPGPGGDWLIAGTRFSGTGVASATVWTSPDAVTWSRIALPRPVGEVVTAARAATNWGERQVVVGSAGTGSDMRAAAWVSQGPGQPFVAVADNPAFDPPANGTGSGAVMDTVAAGALGLFAAGTVEGQATVWYSIDGQQWQSLSGADQAIDHFTDAVVNVILSTPNGVFAGGSFVNHNRLSAGLWYSSDGIHWSPVLSAVGTFFGAGDHVITSLVDIAETGNSEPGTPGLTGILAAGGVRSGATWQPASWISPNGVSWSQASESFPLDGEPPASPGALVYAVTGADGSLFAVGGSPGRQRVWRSSDGLAWSAVPLPGPAREAAGWHLGLAAASGHTTVVADNLPGQPYVLVHEDGSWQEPSANGTFGSPQRTAVPTSLTGGDGTLVMSVQLSDTGQRLGEGSTSVAVLTSSNGKSWRTANVDAFDNARVNQLLAVPNGLLAVGSQPLPGVQSRAEQGWTGAFASVSTDGGVTWPREPVKPTSIGGLEVIGGTGTSGTGTSGTGTSGTGTSGTGTSGTSTSGTGTSRTGTGTAPAATTSTTALGGGISTLPISPGGPLAAVAAGRVGDAQYVIGQVGPQAVGWFSPNGVTWQRPRPLDTTPVLGIEDPLATCGAGNSAVVVGSMTTTGRDGQPAGWVSTDGSAWAGATFAPTPPLGSFTSVFGCLWTGNSFLAYGESTGGGQVEQPALWASSDGTSWQELPTTFTGISGTPAGGVQSAPLDGIATGTTTWLGLSGEGDLPSEVWPAAVGGAAGALFTPAGLWASVDAGDTWQQVNTEVPALMGAVYAQVDAAAYVGEEPVVAGTVDGRLRVWVGTPAVTPAS